VVGVYSVTSWVNHNMYISGVTWWGFCQIWSPYLWVSAFVLPHYRRVFSRNFSQEKSHYSTTSCEISMLGCETFSTADSRRSLAARLLRLQLKQFSACVELPSRRPLNQVTAPKPRSQGETWNSASGRERDRARESNKLIKSKAGRPRTLERGQHCEYKEEEEVCFRRVN
jgi:hypothetical protein